jgi:hypothetical protein
MRPLILFSYRAPDGNAKGSSVLASQAIVRVSPGQTAPTYEEVIADFQTKAVFRLNPSQYDDARDCLPKPETQ